MDCQKSDAVLSVRGLVKRFTLHNLGGREIRGLDGVSLEVRSGEHVALAGGSGAGKSSLLKCVFRTYLPTTGQVWLRQASGETVDLATLQDHEVADCRERDLGYVSQFLRPEPRRSTFEVVTQAGVRRGMEPDAAREAAAAALRRVAIEEDLWGSYASLLSGGEKQRVNLAAGTIAAPRLLLLDEPVSALDPANRERVLDLIADLTKRGVAVLGVFHDLDAMRRLASRVVVLDRGRVVAEGAPDDVLERLGRGADLAASNEETAR